MPTYSTAGPPSRGVEIQTTSVSCGEALLMTFHAKRVPDYREHFCTLVWASGLSPLSLFVQSESRCREGRITKSA
jgi:hypothetical protein